MDWGHNETDSNGNCTRSSTVIFINSFSHIFTTLKPIGKIEGENNSQLIDTKICRKVKRNCLA